jgi:DNA mismatch endonuclease, patch repair protein
MARSEGNASPFRLWQLNIYCETKPRGGHCTTNVPSRLQVSLVEGRNVGGKVRQEHDRPIGKLCAMRPGQTTPSFKGLRPASRNASATARGTSAKMNTRCELILRRELWKRGIRFRIHGTGLPGRPDIVFTKHRLAVFCDGDFWHGRDLSSRLAKLAKGHNSKYWVAKIRKNAERDRLQIQALEAMGWKVLRFWETDVYRQNCGVADQIAAALDQLNSERSGSSKLSSLRELNLAAKPISKRRTKSGDSHEPTAAAGASPMVTTSTS